MEVRTLESTLLHTCRLRLITDYPAQIRECLGALTVEQIWWRPNERANAIGNLVLHLAGSTRYWVGHSIGSLPFSRDRAAEFAERSPWPREALLSRLDEAFAEAARVLEAFDPARLIETTDRTGKTTTFAQILLHATHHVAVHTGQIVYATKLLREGAIDELWMKTR